MTRSERAALWLAHLDAQQRSHLLPSAYCRAHSLSPKSFSYWRRRRRSVPTRASGPRLVPVRLIEEPTGTGADVAGSGVRLRAAGVQIDVAVQFDASTLRRVLNVLGGAHAE